MDRTTVAVSKEALFDLQELKAWLGRENGRTVGLDEALRTAVREALDQRRTVKGDNR